MSKKCLIVFSGYNQRAVIAFLRTLEKNKILYGIVAASKNDTIYDTEYKRKIITVRTVKELEINDFINYINFFKEQIKADEYLIAPSTEALNRFLLSNRQILETLELTIPIVSKEIYEIISDKYCFSNLCLEYGINVPHQYSDIDYLNLPFVAKPKKYFSGNGIAYSPILVFSELEKKEFFMHYNEDDFYFQEFISGKSYYLLYYFHNSGEVYKFSQMNIIQQPDGKSIVYAVSSDVHLTEESIKYENLFKSIHYTGFVMVEIMEQNGINYMIEANPRFWGPSQLFVDANFNFFEAFLNDIGFLVNTPQFSGNINSCSYFWFGGIVGTLKTYKKLKCHSENEDFIFENLPQLINSDIYRRRDTLNIFKNEII
jgi:predicted ATP-grasp superfamily ATP-dependent carboligase